MIANIAKYGLKGKIYWRTAIANKGNIAVLRGNSIKLFDFQKGDVTRTISRLGNGIITISHDQTKLCVANATSQNKVIIAEYTMEDGVFQKIGTHSICSINTDSGGIFFSQDDNYVFFCTDGKKVWKSKFGTNECKCIYQVKSTDQSTVTDRFQRISLDVFTDKLLISITSPTTAMNNGFDILNIDGSIVKSIRFYEEWVLSRVPKVKWLGNDAVFLYDPYNIPKDHAFFHRIVLDSNNDRMTPVPIDISKQRAIRVQDVCFSPFRSFCLIVWAPSIMNGECTVDLYDTKTWEMLGEIETSYYHDASFSACESFACVCTEEHLYRIELPN